MGWIAYGLISAQAPHLLRTAALCGMLAGVGMGLGAADFLDQPAMAQYRARYAERKTRHVVFMLAGGAALALVAWILPLGLLTALFLHGMVAGMCLAGAIVLARAR